MRSNLISLKFLTFIFFFLFSLFGRAEKDPLHKRVFTTKVSEVKADAGGPSKKPVMDKWSFKDGKVFSDFLYDKFQYKWLKYRINKDSIFTDSTDTEVRMLEVEATSTDEANQTVAITFTVQEWDIEGEVKITKNDKLKKHFEITGREKGGKPKKSKKKKVVAPNGEAEQKSGDEQKKE
jgi:hypothetical protein